MILKNCTIIENGKELVRDILIKDGKIADIAEEIEGNVGLDVAERYVIPGLIDSHVHMRDPGQTHKEDFLTGSRACAAGGITTFLDMPNNSDPIITVKALEEKRMHAKKSIVNYGFHFGSAVGNEDEIKKAKNVASTKVYMNLTTGKMLIEKDPALKKIFKASRLVTVHAEGNKVEKAIVLSKECGNRLYICHVPDRESLDTIREYKDKNIFVEVTPHHLFLSEEDDKDAFTKIKPSLKSVMDNEALYNAIKEGLVDTIATDHSPHSVGEKLGIDPPTGFPGVETMLPLLLDAMNKGFFSLDQIIKLCCENPARIFGIRNKGFIKVGYDADLVVLDMDLVEEVREDMLFTKVKWSPYDGKVLKGWPVITIVNGRIAFDHGEVVATVPGKEVEFNA
jgi:dihydroorotase